MPARIRDFIKKETVLCIAAVCAVFTMIPVPPDSAYPGYIDGKVLCLLACLMAVLAGIEDCGVFGWISSRLMRRANGRTLGVILVLLPFFCSMLVTNDVALLTFVPFTLMLLRQINCPSAAVPLLVLQTMAANLGSMATPVGNPQNLFLYSAYGLHAGEFFSVTLPLTGISFLALTAAALPVLPKTIREFVPEQTKLQNPGKLAGYAVLFLLCLLTVFRVLHYGITTVLVIAAVAVMEPKLLRRLDYALLATFVCFFIVSGNLGRIDAVRELLQTLLERSTLLTAAAASQLISNVPAAVLLSEFTDRWQPLLEGVNIGGLGTPIASLASLITLKLYLRSPGAKAGRFMAVFLLANAAGLLLLLGAALCF